eukprot:Nitzschia sp. Nitz4//scaffold154_size52827//48170//48874//NITZ4_006787-RA/size52827-processed-gene-0.51-mRNA-1//1//CDS//3329537341//2366//frame0
MGRKKVSTTEFELDPQIYEDEENTEIVYHESPKVVNKDGLSKDGNTRRRRVSKQIAAVLCLLLVILAVVLGVTLSGGNNNNPQVTNKGVDNAVNSTLISNDQCYSAIESTPDGSSDVGVLSSSDENLFSNSAGTCGTASYGASPGKWYQFTGTGDSVWITECTQGCTVSLDSMIVAEVTVFEGSCDNLICVDGMGDLAQEGPLEIATTEGVTYFVYIQGQNGVTGLYELSFEKR